MSSTVTSTVVSSFVLSIKLNTVTTNANFPTICRTSNIIYINVNFTKCWNVFSCLTGSFAFICKHIYREMDYSVSQIMFGIA